MTKQELAIYKKRRGLILKLARGGMSQSAIARLLGMKRQRVNQIVRENGSK